MGRCWLMAEAAVQALLYLGVLLLLGPEIFARYIAPELMSERRHALFDFLELTGGALVLFVSSWSVVATLRETLGYVDGPLLRDYLAESRHGRAVLLRTTLALVLLGLPRLAPNRWTDAAFVVPGVGVLFTMSMVSHNANIGGWGPVLTDFSHLIAVLPWLAAVWGVAFLVRTEVSRQQLVAVMERVSAVGLASVTVLLWTGAFSASLHVTQASTLVTTSYGWSLVAKVALVLIVMGIGAANRWLFLPLLKRTDPGPSPNLDANPGFINALRLEAVLLALVLALTALLTTLPVPH